MHRECTKKKTRESPALTKNDNEPVKCFSVSGKNCGERYGRHVQCDAARSGYEHRPKFYEYQGIFDGQQQNGQGNENRRTEKRYRAAILRD